ncbi:unnamed protein product, partial [Penicillium salamii]
RQTVLWLAVFHQNKELVALLLSKGANPDAADQDGISPWIEACIKNKDVIKYLFLDHWNNVCPELKSETCTGNAEMIRDAATNADPGALRTQLRRGENVDAVDHQGRTALHLAAAHGNLLAVKSLLCQNTIDPGALDQRNRTPLHAAAMGGHLEGRSAAASNESFPELPGYPWQHSTVVGNVKTSRRCHEEASERG